MYRAHLRLLAVGSAGLSIALTASVAAAVAGANLGIDSAIFWVGQSPIWRRVFWALSLILTMASGSVILSQKKLSTLELLQASAIAAFCVCLAVSIVQVIHPPPGPAFSSHALLQVIEYSIAPTAVVTAPVAGVLLAHGTRRITRPQTAGGTRSLITFGTAGLFLSAGLYALLRHLPLDSHWRVILAVVLGLISLSFLIASGLLLLSRKAAHQNSDD